MWSNRYQVLALVTLVFLGSFAGQCGSNSGDPSGGTTAGAESGSPGVESGSSADEKISLPSGSDNLEQGVFSFDGFEAMARFYNKKPEELKIVAQNANFDPKDFDSQSIEDLTAFLNFIHKAVPHLYALEQGMSEESWVFFGLLAEYTAESQQPGFVKYTSRDKLELFGRPLKTANLLGKDWRNQISGLAALFDFSFPMFNSGETPYPATYPTQKADLIAQIKAVFDDSLITPEIEAAISDLADQIFSNSHFSLGGVLYELDLEGMAGNFTHAEITIQQ